MTGRWHSPTDAGQPFVDAATGAPIGTLSSAGIDFAAVVAHGRDVGGPALRALTFHQRATILRSLGKLLLEDASRDVLYPLSARTGATRSDSWIDIEGGAGVLLSYASRARRELPNGHIVLDGPVENLSRDGSFVGVHVLTPRTGVEVQINAFNFPVWGMLEKLAPAFLAAVPTIVKPAPETAFVAEAAVRLMIGSGLLPEGSLQLICGDPGDLLEHLDGRDSVAFTGSATTAARLRTHPAIAERSVRLAVEADSINAAILAPGAGPDTPEFDLFVSEVVKEMTVKAGQKCTAIRRALVPHEHLGAAEEALRSALGKIVVGDPATADMGPLVNTARRDDVARSLGALAPVTEPILASCDFGDVDTTLGAFFAPTLLRATDRFSPVVHTTEVFGPVATVVGYGSVAEAVELAAAGQGSLVASIFGSAADEVTELALGIASHHGRVLIVDSSMAAASTGHGSPLPHLVHGGPGRAGGGEELGGMRSVHRHLQRTALQGSPDRLTAICGQYISGAARAEDRRHPFRRTFDELAVGDSITTGSRVVTRQDVDTFARTTGDTFYAHVDDEAAKRNPLFDGLVAHGYLVLSLAAGLFVWPEEGPVLANYGIDRLRFATPTYPGDEIHVVLTCKRKKQLDGRGYGEVAWDTQVINQRGEVAAAYDVLTMVANSPGVNGAPPAAGAAT